MVLLLVLDGFLPKKIEKDVISVRIPAEMLAELDTKAAAYDISRNELINQCIKFALENMNTSK